MGTDVAFVLAAIIGYALGSVPFGLVITRIAGLGDVRSIGSGNIGTTNVLRTGRKELAALTLLCDILKGTAAVLIGALWGEGTALVAGAAAFLGHLYPVWLRFKGGKGVATYIGALLGFVPVAGVLFLVIWLCVAIITRMSSASALTASALAPLCVLAFSGSWPGAIVFAALSALLWYAHRENLARLRAGTESRIGEKSGVKE